MLNNKTIAVVVPAYNEENQILKVIKTMPSFVDKIVIVNDLSKDKTKEVVEKYIKEKKSEIHIIAKNEGQAADDNFSRAEKVAKEIQRKEIKLYTPFKMSNKQPEKDRIILINHTKNAGVGASIASGHRWCRDNNIDCTVVMDGDGQMDPSELESICIPVIKESIDYVKGNRLKHRSALLVMPKIRYLGNSILSLLTKIASGYWRVSDTQTGYTAISLAALKSIRLYKIYKSYGYPNDILVKLNIAFCTIKEVEIKPVYNVGEQSKMKIWKVIPTLSFLLTKLFFKRLYVKYLFRDFHPLFLLYHMAFLLLIIDVPFLIEVIKSINPGYILPNQTLLIFMFLTISGFQSLFFAMWMDMMDNDRLQY